MKQRIEAPVNGGRNYNGPKVCLLYTSLAGSGTGARRPGRLRYRPFQPALRRGRGGGAPPRPARVARTGPAGTLLPGERGAGHRRGV